VSYDTAWGSIFINLHPRTWRREGDVQVHASPYDMALAPSLKTAPALDCRLTVTNLTLAPLTGGRPALSGRTIVLAAQAPRPNEPNQRAYSPHFTYIPLSRDYVAVGELRGLDLTYVPHRLTFDLRGGPTCPDGLHEPVRVDTVLHQRRMTGAYNWLDVIGSV
jgi:hypothetical protein